MMLKLLIFLLSVFTIEINEKPHEWTVYKVFINKYMIAN